MEQPLRCRMPRFDSPESEGNTVATALAAKLVSISTIEPDYDAADDAHTHLQQLIKDLKGEE